MVDQWIFYDKVIDIFEGLFDKLLDFVFDGLLLLGRLIGFVMILGY